jgi:hypothetical protein
MPRFPGSNIPVLQEVEEKKRGRLLNTDRLDRKYTEQTFFSKSKASPKFTWWACGAGEGHILKLDFVGEGRQFFDISLLEMGAIILKKIDARSHTLQSSDYPERTTEKKCEELWQTVSHMETVSKLNTSTVRSRPSYTSTLMCKCRRQEALYA